MSHDAYICYDEKDKKVSDAIYNIFEENNISSWIKSREMSPGDPVDKITNAIEDSKCFVLIYSRNSKDTNYVITETDIAFSRDIPIVVFNIDDSSFVGNLEFILENQTKIPAFPNPKRQLEALVKETSNKVGKSGNSVKIDSKYLKAFDKIDPKRKENSIKKYVAIAIPIVAVIILIYLFVIVPTGQKTTDDGIFAMNVTDVDVSGSDGNYKYTVFGESYNMPADSDKYLMNIQFFDKNENMLFEVNSTADEFKSGVICSCNLDEDNITHVGFKLIDLNNKILSREDYAVA